MCIILIFRLFRVFRRPPSLVLGLSVLQVLVVYGRPRSRAVWRRGRGSVGKCSAPNTPDLRPGVVW